MVPLVVAVVVARWWWVQQNLHVCELPATLQLYAKHGICSGCAYAVKGFVLVSECYVLQLELVAKSASSRQVPVTDDSGVCNVFLAGLFGG